MKAILIIDMPKSCEDCPCYQPEMNYETIEYHYCGVDGHEIFTRKISRCPLKPLGLKVEEYGLETWNTRDGIFLCEKGLFDEIYGDDEE